QSQFDSAFFVAVQELKSRAGRVGGNAIVHMRQDIDIDTDGMQYFYLQMYGTAVKVKQPPAARTEET
ncbi:MAG: heavy metal-binding domain-containing protein, partial [Planctomycetaceae bacterium]